MRLLWALNGSEQCFQKMWLYYNSVSSFMSQTKMATTQKQRMLQNYIYYFNPYMEKSYESI